MAEKKNTANPAALLNEPMQTMYGVLCQLIGGGLAPAEARDVLCAMVGRVLEVHPATAPTLGVNE